MRRNIYFRAIALCCTVFIVNIIIVTDIYGQKADKGPSKIKITGTVTGMDGQPAAGAEIYIDSISTGITTDDLGKYKVKVPSGAQTVFAFSPMKGSGEAAIDGKTVVDISLDPRKDLRTDFTVVASKELKTNPAPKKAKKINTYTNIFQMIRQEVPGVLVSGSDIVIQQQNSFFGSSTPLFVVNGVRVNRIDYINPVDVESIVLLKGSQAVIYGIEGANGVLSITLRTGVEK